MASTTYNNICWHQTKTFALILIRAKLNLTVHVAHVALTSDYDDLTTTDDVLAKMKSTRGGASWGTIPDGTSTTIEGIDLYHALLANPLGGGLASVGAICDSQQGFAVSGGIVGDFTTLDAATLWDVLVFAHELG